MDLNRRDLEEIIKHEIVKETVKIWKAIYEVMKEVKEIKEQNVKLTKAIMKIHKINE